MGDVSRISASSFRVSCSADKFYQTLEKAGITVEDFTGHIGVILGTNTAEDPEDDKELIDAAWEFMRKLYNIGTHCL